MSCGVEWSGAGLESVKNTNPSTCCPFFSCSQPKTVSYASYSWYEILHSCLLLPDLCFNHSPIHTILHLKSSRYKQAHLKCLCSFPSDNLAMRVQIHLTLRFADDIILKGGVRRRALESGGFSGHHFFTPSYRHKVESDSQALLAMVQRVTCSRFF